MMSTAGSRLTAAAVRRSARGVDGVGKAARIRRADGRYHASNVIRLKTLNLGNLIFVLALIQLGWLIWYYYTGSGGPQELVARVLSIALILQILFMYQQDYLYKLLPPRANQHHRRRSISASAPTPSIISGWSSRRSRSTRQGSYTTQDFIVGLLMFLLVMELSRLAHPVLFWINIVLVVYTLYGYLSPLDFFWHPGTTFYRVVTSSTVELSTGIYGIYGQLALTLIAAFLLLAGVANGFGAQSAMINVMRRLAGRSRQMVPQTAVLGSLCDRHDQRQRLGQRRRGRHHHHPADEALRRARRVRRRGRDRGLDGRADHAADDGRRRLPDVGISRRALLGRGDARLRAGLRLLRLARRSPSICCACACCRATRSSAPVVPLYDQIKTGIFFSSVLFLHLPDGLGSAPASCWRRSTPRASCSCLLLVAFLYFKYVAEGSRRSRRRRCSATSGSRSRRMPT